MPAAVWEREEKRPSREQRSFGGEPGWRHESLSGAGERLSDEELAYDLETLRVALREWRKPSSAYDEAQRGLVVATLAEYAAEGAR